MTAVLSVSAATCFASDIVDISVGVDGWTVLPISDNGVTTHLIAARDDDEALATDIDVVLYERVGDLWTATAYDPIVSKEDAMIDLANEFGLSDPFLGDWQIELDEEDVFDIILPRVPFGKGFFVTDPLYQAAQQLDNPESLVEGAESAGLAAGSSSINTGAVSGGTGIGGAMPADEDCLRSTIASGIDAYLADPTLTIQEIEAVSHDDEVARICFCWERDFRGAPSAWSAWNCNGWGLDSTDPVAGTCTWSTNATRLRTRTVRRRCLNCTVFNFTQFQNQWGTLTLTVPMNADGTCSQPTACGAPQSNTGTGWTPPGPVYTWP